jgi:hypothetical protein
VKENLPDYSVKLNNILTTSWSNYPIKRDKYNNEFIVIPLYFTSTDDGLIRVSKFTIEYTLTATIYKKDQSNLVEELNEHIVFTEEELVTIHFIVSSASPGIITFSNLNLIYNIPPERKMDIPTINAYEDTENLNLLVLSNFFTDTDEPTTGLNYSVVKNSQSDHVEVFTNYSNILKFRPITPNWYGETDIVVQAVDSGLKKTYSNPFKIIINPVNDEPTAEVKIPDVTLVEGEQDKKLDLELREYFSDVEDDMLYYKVVIDPKKLIPNKDDKDIKIIKNDDNILEISSIDDFNTFNGSRNNPIPLWVYCDDDVDIDTIEDNDYTFQEILITVLPVNDAPKWKSIPKITVNEDEDSAFKGFINMYDYVSDDETEDSFLEINIAGTNPDITLVRGAKGELNLQTDPNYFGQTVVTLTATDEKHAMSSTTFELVIMPINDGPTIDILSHNQLQVVNGSQKFTGKMSDIEGTIKLVEVKIETMDIAGETEVFDWQRAKLNMRTNNWTYDWDTKMVPDGEYKLTARVYDGELADEEFVVIQIRNGKNFEPIVDIAYPEEYAEVNGTVIITGTVSDPDLDGINDLQIRVGADMDWTKIPLKSENETVWSFTWDSTMIDDGEANVMVKAYDGRAWSVPSSRIITINNSVEGSLINDQTTTDAEEDYTGWIIAVILVVIIIILSLIVMYSIISRGRKRVEEYVPDGRMESLDDLERAVTPALAPGSAIGAHHALPSAAPVSVPTLPPVAGGPADAPVLPTLPPVNTGAAQAPAQLPALPAANIQNTTKQDQM